MIDRDELIEKKVLRKVLNWKKGVKGEKQGGKKNRGMKTFHSLCLTFLVHTRTTVTLECGDLPHQSTTIEPLFPTLPQPLYRATPYNPTSTTSLLYSACLFVYIELHKSPGFTYNNSPRSLLSPKNPQKYLTESPYWAHSRSSDAN